MEDRRRFKKETVNHQAAGKFNDRLARFGYILGLLPFALVAIVVLIRDRNRPKLKWYPILRRIFRQHSWMDSSIGKGERHGSRLRIPVISRTKKPTGTH